MICNCLLYTYFSPIPRHGVRAIRGKGIFQDAIFLHCIPNTIVVFLRDIFLHFMANNCTIAPPLEPEIRKIVQQCSIQNLESSCIFACLYWYVSSSCLFFLLPRPAAVGVVCPLRLAPFPIGCLCPFCCCVLQLFLPIRVEIVFLCFNFLLCIPLDVF